MYMVNTSSRYFHTFFNDIKYIKIPLVFFLKSFNMSPLSFNVTNNVANWTKEVIRNIKCYHAKQEN